MYSIYFRSLQDFYVLEDTYGWKKGQMLHPLSEGAGGTLQAAAAAGSFASVPEKKKTNHRVNFLDTFLGT